MLRYILDTSVAVRWVVEDFAHSNAVNVFSENVERFIYSVVLRYPMAENMYIKSRSVY